MATFENVVSTSPYQCMFTLNDTHVAYANTLRRLIMTGVETVGFRADMTSMGTTTDVTIINNTTPMTNEMLAHRIGLLPIHIENPITWVTNTDKFMFKLDVSGDKNNIKDVVAADFKVTEIVPTENDPVERPSTNFFKADEITGDTCLIATLYPGESQKVTIIARASLGTGRENARFQPTSQCSYEYTRDTSEVRRKEFFTKWLSSAKMVDSSVLDESSEQFKALQREFNTMEVARCYLINEKGEPYSFDFTVESIGVLKCSYIIQRACEVGEAMVSRYVNIDKGKPLEEVRISSADSRILGFDFLIRGHDHTLGNLIQTYLEQNNMDNISGKTNITYVGYTVPHPLRDEMIIRIGVKDGQELTARKAFAEAATGCVDLFQKMKISWLSATGGAPVKPTTPVKPKSVTLLRRK